ncbi:hypothetical protein ABFS82_09G057300 [Erythranthe guttata]
MPSPVIPRSKSAPDINSPDSPSNEPASTKSVRSSRSTGSPVTTTPWPTKLAEYIKSKPKNSDLTEERLHEFNRRYANNTSSSPYYKGLTDFSLVINREKLSGSSPGRESHAATSFVSSGSRTSFVVKVQEWGSSCFTSKRNERTSLSSSASSSSWTKSSSSTKQSHDTRFMTSSSSSASSKVTETNIKTMRNDSQSEKKKVTFPNTTPTTEKPLRERDTEPQPSMLPLPPPTVSPPELLPYPLPLISPPQPPAVQAPPPPLAWTPGAGGGNEREYVWADTYRPYWLQEFLCNRNKALWLKSIVRNWHDKAEQCGHFIFEGNPGVGKRTMIWALLREAFGEDKVQAREECKKFYLKGEAVGSIFVNLLVSPQHVEVNLSELKGYEKHIIVELIKEKNNIPSDTTTLNCNGDNCKAIILHEAEKLSTDALSYIKWMLERFKGCNKVFFCCSDAKKLQPIVPLCTYVQLLEPSVEEILEVLAFIAKREGIQLPQPLAYKIAINSKNNLRQAIRSFEATWHFSGCSDSLKEDQDIKMGWEDRIANIAKNVLKEQSPKQLYNIRGELQNLIEHNVAPEFIFQSLKDELKNILPEELKQQFDHLYDEYQKYHAVSRYLLSATQQEELGKKQHDQRKNVQQFMRIEEFIARFMSWYKGLVNKEYT